MGPPGIQPILRGAGRLRFPHKRTSLSGTWTGVSVTGIGVNKPSGLAPVALSQTGTYFIKVIPNPPQSAATIGSVNMQLLGASVGALALDGTATTASFTNGAPKLYTFPGSLAQGTGILA